MTLSAIASYNKNILTWQKRHSIINKGMICGEFFFSITCLVIGILFIKNSLPVSSKISFICGIASLGIGGFYLTTNTLTICLSFCTSKKKKFTYINYPQSNNADSVTQIDHSYFPNSLKFGDKISAGAYWNSNLKQFDPWIHPENGKFFLVLHKNVGEPFSKDTSIVYVEKIEEDEKNTVLLNGCEVKVVYHYSQIGYLKQEVTVDNKGNPLCRFGYGDYGYLELDCAYVIPEAGTVVKCQKWIKGSKVTQCQLLGVPITNGN